VLITIGFLYFFIYESTWVLIVSNMLLNGHYRPFNGTIAHHKEKTKPTPKGPKGLECCSHDIFAEQRAKE
jgi:hypothetical protein